MNKGKQLILFVSFSVLSFLLFFGAVMSADKYFVQINSLCHSSYIYSATTQEPDAADDDGYYQFHAGISFGLSDNTKTSINADIVMQSSGADYTDLVYWNANRLDIYEIAISKNIAKKKGLHIGDKLYSKHLVDGTTYEYSIAQIIPEVANVRGKGNAFSNGVIVMGYDNQYVENIMHIGLLYTRASIEDLSDQIAELPTDMIYRDDEIIAAIKSLFPYVVVFTGIAIMFTIVIVLMCAKDISHNFRRQIVIGFEKKDLDKSFYRMIVGNGILAIVFTLIPSLIVSYFKNFCQTEVIFLFFMLFFEVVTLLLLAIRVNWRLWRI